MIKAVVLDIDGVIVGTKKGINLPNPSFRVCQALRKVHNSGIPVVFITAKTSLAAFKNIKHVGIDNPHIADSGAVLFNPVRGELLHVKPMPPADIRHVLSSMPKNTLINLFTTKDYFVVEEMQDKFSDFVKKYSGLMQRLPVPFNSFDKIINNEKVVKINIYAFSSKEKKKLNEMISKSKGEIAYRWGGHPHLAPVEVMIVTSSGVSKRSGLETLAKYLKVPLNEVLGVGDMLQDWDFMEACGYKATLVNGSEGLKDKLNLSDKKQFMGGHVDQNGILDILKYFKLI